MFRLRIGPGPIAMFPKYAASCRDEAWSARDDPWARGRGLAVFLTFIFGATTAGSAVWGKLSAMEGLPIAYFVAAAGVVLAIPMTWRWKLQTGVGIDFSPAMLARAHCRAES